MADKEWLTQEEVANALGVPVDKVRAVVSALAGTGVIRTQRDPLDKRYILVHSSSVEIIRKSIFGG